jgi:hypothetical protein
MSSLLLVPPTPRSAALELFNQDLASGQAVDLRELTELTLIQLATDNPSSRGATVLEWNPDRRQVEFLELDGVLVNPAWCVSSGDWYKCTKREPSAPYQVVGAQTRDDFERGQRLDYNHTRVLRTGLCVILSGPRGTKSGCVRGAFLLSNWPVTSILLGHEAIRAARS